MVHATHFLTILSLLPLSLAVSVSNTTTQPAPNPPFANLALPPAHAARDVLGVAHPSPSTTHSHGIKRNVEKSRGVRAHSPRDLPAIVGDIPAITIGGIDLPLIARSHSGSGLSKRSTDNATLLPLATTENTFIVPVSIGSPPTTYPLQLDLASSDLLLASSLCTSSSCPSSSSTNPYYDVAKSQAGWEEVNGNGTLWNTSYADGTVASGFIGREVITLGESVVQGQVFGVINSTNLTLSDQSISGILGLGFPRLSVMGHVLLRESEAATTLNATPTATDNTTASVTGTSNSSSTSTTSSANATSTDIAYLPTLLENLVRTPHLPYPVFALALAPPINDPSSSASSSAASASSTARYDPSHGSLTLGGVSAFYVDEKEGSGRTVGDIEWFDVVPFGQPLTNNDTTTNDTSAESVTTSDATATATASSSASSMRKRSDESQIDSLPASTTALSQEEYLQWALTLQNISLNGTVITPNSSYASLGLGSVALLDAGFNGIAGPQQDVTRIFSTITDAREVQTGQWVVPCNTKMTIGFSFGGRYIQLQPSDWIYAGVENSELCMAWPIAQEGTGDGIDWQLGTPFLKNVYSIFSYGINGKQAPLVGFLPMEYSSDTSDNSTTTSETSTADPDSPTPTTIEGLSLTTTLRTRLPNAVLASPTFPTPSYAYSSSPYVLQTGALQFMGLGNDTEYEVGDVAVVSVDSSAVSSIAVGGGSSNSDGAVSGAERRVLKSGTGLGVGMIAGGVLLGTMLI
ncbi:peptidase [Cryptococcus wingfieldii CBS 7118]|uniref:Peptidase n=1 Tax=Cryptococcus wingfieldii CBS 7118 TaxID=1295528 RepID=A0A1E3J2D0_9TREE|nr:peptidase [Cryptococcus wingfieldii CBS 7118]ODN94825.1 peptidase [Cryptococcus wingfieldii CBS 7118]